MAAAAPSAAWLGLDARPSITSECPSSPVSTAYAGLGSPRRSLQIADKMPRLSLDGMILPPAARVCSLCPKGHKLMWITSEERGSCDQCARPLGPGEELEECSACNWWLCQDCSARGRLDPLAPEQAGAHPPRAESLDSSLATDSAFAAPPGPEGNMREGTDASLATTERGTSVAVEFYQATGHRGWAAGPHGCLAGDPRLGGAEAHQREWADAPRLGGPALSTIRESSSSGGRCSASARCLACGGSGCGLCKAAAVPAGAPEPVEEGASDDEEGASDDEDDAPADDGAAPFVAPLPPSRVPWLRWSRISRQPADGHRPGEEASAAAAPAGAAPGVEALRKGITVAYWGTAAQEFKHCLLKVDGRLNFLRVEANGELLASVRLHLITDVVAGPEAAALCAAPLAAGGAGGPPAGAVVVRHGGLGAPLDHAHAMVLVPSEGQDAASCLLDCVKAAPDRQRATESAAQVLQRWWRAPGAARRLPAEGPVPSKAGAREGLPKARELVHIAPPPCQAPRAEAKVGHAPAGAGETPHGLPGLAAGLAVAVAPLVKHWGLGDLLLPAALPEDPELQDLKGQKARAGGAAAGELLERLRGGLEALGGCAACAVSDRAPARPGAARQAAELIVEEAVARPPASSGACAWGGGPRSPAHRAPHPSAVSLPAAELVDETATARPEGAPRGASQRGTPCSMPSTPVLGPASGTASPQTQGAWSAGRGEAAEAAPGGPRRAPPPPPRWGWPGEATAGAPHRSREEQIELAEAEQRARRRAREEAIELAEAEQRARRRAREEAIERERQLAVEALERARREAEQEQRQARQQAEEEEAARQEAQRCAERAARESRELAARQAEEEARAEAQLRAERAAREAREAAAQQAAPVPGAARAAGALAPPAAARLPLAPAPRAEGKRALQATPVAEAAPRVPPLALSQIAGAPLVAATVVPQCDAQGGQDAPAAAPRSGRGAAQAPPWSTPESARRRQQHSLQQREDKGCMFSPGRPECMGRSGSQQCSQQ